MSGPWFSRARQSVVAARWPGAPANVAPNLNAYRAYPNEDVAAAIDALAARMPREVPAQLLDLAPNTIRVILSGRGRAIDVTRGRDERRCEVTVYSFEAAGPRIVPPARHVEQHQDVEVQDVVELLAAPDAVHPAALFMPLPIES